MSAKNLVRHTMMSLVDFANVVLEHNLSTTEKDKIVNYAREVLTTDWDNLWVIIEAWLRNSDLKCLDDSIRDFVAQVPQFSDWGTFAINIINNRYQNYWQAFFENLKRAKTLLE